MDRVKLLSLIISYSNNRKQIQTLILSFIHQYLFTEHLLCARHHYFSCQIFSEHLLRAREMKVEASEVEQ